MYFCDILQFWCFYNVILCVEMYAHILLYKVVIFLSVAKDLANYWTDMVLLFSEAFYRSREGINYLGRNAFTP